jgi:hypothetical protein
LIDGLHGSRPDNFKQKKRRPDAPLLFLVTFSTVARYDRVTSFLKKQIDKHGLEDPVEDDTVGMFTNPFFDKLYKNLVDNGATGYCVALEVGIDIENLDIEDIEIALDDVAARDVDRVFNNLLNGSYNHLNAFTSQYLAAGCEQ